MLTRRGTSISILLLSLLFSNFSYGQVAKWQLRGEKYVEMRLRRVLGKLVTLGLDGGQMTRVAMNCEVDKLMAITKFSLFSQSPRFGTRKSDLMSWRNLGSSFGENSGALLTISIGAGWLAGPQGIWAAVGGPMVAKPTWGNNIGIGNSGYVQNSMGFTVPPENGIWMFTWTPKPKSDTASTISWFTSPPGQPNYNSETTKDPKWNFGTTSHFLSNSGPTIPPSWNFGPTNNINWNFGPTNTPNWNFGPTNTPNWNFGPTNTPNWNFGPTNTPNWNFGPTSTPNWNFGPANNPFRPYNSSNGKNWIVDPLNERDVFVASKADDYSTVKPTKRAIESNSNAFTKDIPPWRLPNNATQSTASKASSYSPIQPTTERKWNVFTKEIPPWRLPDNATHSATSTSRTYFPIQPTIERKSPNARTPSQRTFLFGD